MSGVVSVERTMFAQLVGSDNQGGLLFMVSNKVVTELAGDWSAPVQFRFRSEGGLMLEMEVREISGDLTLRDLGRLGK